jgi:hypothetical protein
MRDHLTLVLNARLLDGLSPGDLRVWARDIRARARQIEDYAKQAAVWEGHSRKVAKMRRTRALSEKEARASLLRRRNIEVLRLARRGLTNPQIITWLEDNGYGALTRGTISQIIGTHMKRVGAEYALTRRKAHRNAKL